MRIKLNYCDILFLAALIWLTLKWTCEAEILQRWWSNFVSCIRKIRRHGIRSVCKIFNFLSPAFLPSLLWLPQDSLSMVGLPSQRPIFTSHLKKCSFPKITLTGTPVFSWSSMAMENIPSLKTFTPRMVVAFSLWIKAYCAIPNPTIWTNSSYHWNLIDPGLRILEPVLNAGVPLSNNFIPIYKNTKEFFFS